MGYSEDNIDQELKEAIIADMDFLEKHKAHQKWAAEHPVLSWFYDIRYWPWWAKRVLWEEPIMATKHGFQRMFRGYDDTAFWGLDSYITDIALPVLKKYRSRDIFGVPWNHKTNDSHTVESWHAELDKMINAFQHIKDDSWYDVGITKEQREKTANEIREGLSSFAEHFQGLWD